MSESFSAQQQSGVIPAYAFNQYATDPNAQAFFTAVNGLAQGYLDWFAATPLAVYTSDAIVGPLLDWTAQGIYGVSRPVVTTNTSVSTGPFGTSALGTHTLGTLKTTTSGSAQTLDDDYYKRVLTWITYRGDGLHFTIPWLLRRIERFLGGVNGTGVPLSLNDRPGVTVSGPNFTISIPTSAAAQTLSRLLTQGVLPFPVGYTISVTLLPVLLSDSGSPILSDGGSPIIIS